MNDLSISTIAFFRAAGIFRVKSDVKARERFDEALPDFDGFAGTLADADVLFNALIEYREAEKARKIADAIAKEEKRAQREAEKAEREAAKAALPIATGFSSIDEKIKRLPPGAYVLSSAQNNTTIDAIGLACIVNFCNVNGASLLVGRLTYNKNGFQQPGLNEEIWYSPEIKPYLVDGHIDLGGYHFLADANVIPTATWPTSGFEGNTPAGIGAIVPATRIELRVSAANKNAQTKIIAATGALTQRNYILRKTGAKAAAAHCIGAVYVNTITGEIRHLEVMPESNCIYDKTGVYTATGEFRPLKGGDVAAFQPGDIHAEKMEKENLEAVVELIEYFNPLNLLAHDLLDFSSRNHHNIKDRSFCAGNMLRAIL